MLPEGVMIRVATRDDVDDLARLKTILVRSWFDDPTYVDSREDYPPKLRARLEELVEHPWFRYWVAEIDGQIVACMSASVTKHLPGPDWTGIGAHLADLIVEPQHRGRGLATALMHEAMDWCRAQDAYAADMHATRMAVPMYRRMGWVEREQEDPDGPFLTLRFPFYQRDDA